MLPVEQPFKAYTGLDGKPLNNGYVYFGQPNVDPIANPVTVFWDAAGTLPAAQPLRTVNGYIMNAGAPANVYFDGTYSELVKDSKARQVFYAPTSDGFSITAAVRNFIASLAGSAGSALLSFVQNLSGAVPRTVQDELRDNVSVKQFGAVGDGVTDDRAAIIAGDAACYAAGKVLHFPAGVYRCSDGIPNKKAKWTGDGAPVMGTFPIVDDKRFLAPSTKAQIPGTTLLFTGTGTQRATTQRSDEFASFSYCVKTAPGIPSSIKGMAIVQDMIVYDAGGALTTITTDQRAGYEVGYMVDMSPRCQHTDFVVFGYFAKAGTVVHTVLQSGLDNPDYCSFIGGSTSGNIGLALLGSQSDDGISAGLSGTNFTSFELFSKDHHSRDKVTDDWGKACVYIDGYTTAVANDINGHFFNSCLIRTYGNHPVILDHASHTQFVTTIFETPLMATPNSNATQLQATSATNDVVFVGCRYSSDIGLYAPTFAGAMAGQMINIGGPFGGVIVSEKDTNSTDVYSIRLGGASAGTGRPAIQFMKGSPTTSTDGWIITRDPSQSDLLDFRWNNVSAFSLLQGGGIGKFGLASGGVKTIATGAIAVGGYSSYSVDTEAAAATDDLDTITGATFVGQRLVLRAANSSRDVVLKDTTGNLRLSSDFTLTNSQDRIELEWDGAAWCEIARSDNTV